MKDKDKVTFPNISSHAFEHPLDRTALMALKKLPGLDWVIKKFTSAIGERRLRLFFLASAVRINSRQFPKIHQRLLEACRILDMPEVPELYIAQNYQVNAAAIGIDRPFIVLTSSLVDTLNEDELQSVIGHELGHILSGHALYTTLLHLLLKLWQFFLGIPGGIYAVIAILLALLEWSRKAELSADRAGLLVSQDITVNDSVEMKLAGGKQVDQMNFEEFLKQGQEFENQGDLLDGALKLALIAGQTHPFPVMRVAELHKWVDAGEYDKILGGEYAKRGEDATRSFGDNLKDTASGYAESFKSSTDPFVSTIKDLGSGVANTGRDLLDFLSKGLGLQDDDNDAV